MQVSRILHSAIASGVSPPLATLTLPAQEFLDETLKKSPEAIQKKKKCMYQRLAWYCIGMLSYNYFLLKGSVFGKTGQNDMNLIEVFFTNFQSV